MTTQEGANVTAAFAVNRRNIPVAMTAKLDISDNFNSLGQSSSSWQRVSELVADRKLQCTVTSMQPGVLSSMDYTCTLTPLVSIELLSNLSYVLQLSFAPPNKAKNHSSLDDSLDDKFGITERPVLIKEASMILIAEDSKFHTALFYLKCFCVPWILGALVVFGIRLYLNDLYVSIPDRLLVTCALAQILQDIPVEALIAEGNLWQPSPYLKLLDELSRFVLITCLFLFWIIYTKDKVLQQALYFVLGKAQICISGHVSSGWTLMQL